MATRPHDPPQGDSRLPLPYSAATATAWSSRNSMWSYIFFIDFAGHVDDPAAAAVLAELTLNVAEIKVLGSYPRAVL